MTMRSRVKVYTIPSGSLYGIAASTTSGRARTKSICTGDLFTNGSWIHIYELIQYRIMFFFLCCVYACVCYVANNVQKNTVPGVRSLVLCMYAPTSGVPRICSIHVFMKWSVKYTRLKRSECICATGAIIIFKRCT